MGLSQKGAQYVHREHVSDPYVKGSLDDLASQIQAIRTQGVFGQNGSPQPPSAPAALNVTVDGNGNFTAVISDAAVAPGTLYLLQHDTSANFPSPISVDLGIARNWKQNLKGQRLFFRCFSRFSASANSPAVYFGTLSHPTPLQG